MSEKFELIDAKDLPMTEEEDVTVLCVGADGEMKRRDAGSFGGNQDTFFLMVKDGGEYTHSGATYEEVYKAMAELKPINFKCYDVTEKGYPVRVLNLANFMENNSYAGRDSIYFMVAYADGGTLSFHWMKDTDELINID